MDALQAAPERQLVHTPGAPRLAVMSFSRDLWVRLGNSAAQGRAAWSRTNRGRGRGLERGVWIAATVLMAIPIFALLIVAALGAVALTFAAVIVAWIWGVLVRAGIIRARTEATVIRVSPLQSDS